MIKEAWEEAGLPAALAERSKRGRRRALRLRKRTLGIDFRAWTTSSSWTCPADFEPVNQDGEVQAFYRWPVPGRSSIEVEHRAGDYFYDANLAFIAFFLRHGLVARDDPDYEALDLGASLGRSSRV